MASNYRAWSKHIRLYGQEVRGRVKRFHGARFLQLVRMVLKQTPKDTRRTVGEWQASAYFPKTGLVGHVRPMSEVIQEAQQVVATMNPFSRTWLVNNMKHIRILEYGLFIPRNPGPSKDRRPHRFGKVWVVNGFSIQAPNGIVRPVLESLNSGVGSSFKISGD
jgi:hypothetical protein